MQKVAQYFNYKAISKISQTIDQNIYYCLNWTTAKPVLSGNFRPWDNWPQKWPFNRCSPEYNGEQRPVFRLSNVSTNESVEKEQWWL